MRGGAYYEAAGETERAGLSPRARGSPGESALAGRPRGPIPACAGEPGMVQLLYPVKRAYPRVRGGASLNRRAAVQAGGLSPRARGSQNLRLPSVCRGGPIPACAGEPRSQTHQRKCNGAYPRVRGGAPHGAILWCSHGGLSPRARGSRVFDIELFWPQGPIPACAGEPGLLSGLEHSSRAYPRVRGGAAAASDRARAQSGLSPRARGSRFQRLIKPVQRGPIPACAGEPTTSSGNMGTGRAYPRVRGGAIMIPAAIVDFAGLSPRARGSR